MFDPYEQLDLNNEACSPPHLNQRIDGKYLIQKLIGSGSSSRVYSAKIYPGSDLVAVKILREACSTKIGERKLALEGKSLLTVSEHKNFVSVYDFGKTEAGEPYLVTELLTGQTLKHLLKDYGSLPVDRALDIGLELLDALKHLHKHGIFHVSFKPSDILLIDYMNKPLPDLRLLDLDSVFNPQLPELYNSELPAEGATFHYLSPEQAIGKSVDESSDIYVFAIILYEMIAGNLPFSGLSAVEVLNVKLTSNIIPFSQTKPNANIPSDLEDIIRRCLQCDRTKRIRSCEELETLLLATRKRTPTTKEHEVDIKNWEKLPRHAYGEPEEEEDGDKKRWLNKFKNMIGRGD